MKTTRLNIFIVCLLSFGTAVIRPLQAQDYSRLSERSIMGTARYVGMSGAMTAIGADPSAVLDNPAGLGLYQRLELTLTFDETLDYTRQIGVNGVSRRALFSCPNASIVFCIPTRGNSKVLFNNIMLSYQRVHSYNRTWSGVGTNGPSLGALLNTPDINWDINFCTLRNNSTHALTVSESGYVNEYALDWAMNLSDRWYFGAGLRFHSYSFSSAGEYRETFDETLTGAKAWYNNNVSSLYFSGITAGLSAGLIWRPAGWLRIGASVQTPSIGSVTTYTSGTFSAMTDSLRYSVAPDSQSEDKKFHLPLHASGSVALQLTAYGFLAVQYDYRHATFNHFPDSHTFRAGLEIIPVMGLYINAGYAYETTFGTTTMNVPMDPAFDRQDTYFLQPLNTQHTSLAIGYRGNHCIVQAAYQYRWQTHRLYPLENASPYDMHADTHRIVLTLGWHRN